MSPMVLQVRCNTFSTSVGTTPTVKLKISGPFISRQCVPAGCVPAVPRPGQQDSEPDHDFAAPPFTIRLGAPRPSVPPDGSLDIQFRIRRHGFYQSGGRAVAKQRTHAPVGFADELAVRVRCHQQDRVRLAGFDQALRDAEAIYESGAAQADIERARLRRYAEAVLHDARRGGQEVIRRLRAEQEHVDIARLDSPRIEKLPGRSNGHIGSAFVGSGDVALAYPRLGYD